MLVFGGVYQKWIISTSAHFNFLPFAYGSKNTLTRITTYSVMFVIDLFQSSTCVFVSFDMFYPIIHFPTAHPAVATMASSCVASPDIPHSSTTASARLTAWCSFGISRIGCQKELLMEEMLQHLGCIKPYR